MKILIITILLAVANFGAAQTHGIPVKSTSLKNLPNGNANDDGAKVPESIKILFDQGYPNNVAAWIIQDKEYRAEYKDSVRLDHIVSYDQGGNIVSVQNELPKSSHPAPIDLYIAKHYPRLQFTVWSKTEADNMKQYYFSRTSETVWFDANGNFLEKTKNKLK